MAGTLTISTLSDGTNSTNTTQCIKGSARAWFYYNGSTQTILGSYNVSSVTYNGTGQYTVNFTTAMPNANYTSATCADYISTLGTPGTTTSISISFSPRSSPVSFVNPTCCSLTVFGY